MPTRLDDARHHAGKIRHFYDHAGFAGHSQAIHHQGELNELYRAASKADINSEDAIGIRELIDMTNSLMNETANRKDDRPCG